MIIASTHTPWSKDTDANVAGTCDSSRGGIYLLPAGLVDA